MKVEIEVESNWLRIGFGIGWNHEEKILVWAFLGWIGNFQFKRKGVKK